jgi:hypothetical protein
MSTGKTSPEGMRSPDVPTVKPLAAADVPTIRPVQLVSCHRGSDGFTQLS